MIEMPTMLLPTIIRSPSDHKAPYIEDLRMKMGMYFKLSHRYPDSTGVRGNKTLPTTCDAFEVTGVEKLEDFDQALATYDPEWTVLAELWYNRWAAVQEVAAVAGRRGSRVVVGCTGTEIVPDMPEDVVVGIDNRHQRVSREPQVPIEQLVGRDVLIYGGMPRRQFAKFCELTLQGVNVVAIFWPAAWFYNSIRTKKYWDIHMQAQQEHDWSVEMLMNEGMKNAIAWWTLGLRRVNRYLKAQSSGEG